MNLEVDTGEMGYDWLDDKGFQWVQGGDCVEVPRARAPTAAWAMPATGGVRCRA